MESVSLADAKAHLSELVERAEAGDPVTITRRGKKTAQKNRARGFASRDGSHGGTAGIRRYFCPPDA